jgi:hypothetical protein
MSSAQTEIHQVDELDNSTLHEDRTLEKPVPVQIEQKGAQYHGGQNIGRQLTDDSLHMDHPINISRLRKNLILTTLAWSGFLANYSASKHISSLGRPLLTSFHQVPI